VGTTTFTQLNRLRNFKRIHLLLTDDGNAAIPFAPAAPNLLSTTPTFTQTAKTSSSPIILSSGNSPVINYGLVEFTPSGKTQDGPQSIDAIWFGLQPMKSPTVYNTNNLAGLEINGLTGLTRVYRK